MRYRNTKELILKDLGVNTSTHTENHVSYCLWGDLQSRIYTGVHSRTASRIFELLRGRVNGILQEMTL